MHLTKKLIEISTMQVVSVIQCLVADIGFVLLGLRVARVRAIFRLPSVYDANVLGVHDPLAYVEWFTPFHVVDPVTGMNVVSPSTRSHHRFSTVITDTDLVRSCHLIPNWGRVMNRRTVPSTALENCNKFFVYPYLRHHDFVLF